MPSSEPSEGPLSFLGLTVRRSFVQGRLYLIYGMGMSALVGLALGAVGGAAFTDAYPLILPIFTVVGAMGALMVFSSDRLKGVVEYLMAYGVSPRRQFLNVLLASLVLVTVVLAVALGVSLTVHLARGGSVPGSMLELLAVYAIPMSYASAAFATTIGMFWTALSSPRFGISSPAGLAPFFGILPPVATLGSIAYIGVMAGSVADSTFVTVTGVAMALVAATVGVLVRMTGRLLRRERLLSPA